MKKKKLFTGRLPSGKTTTSETVYVREWRKLSRELVKALGEDKFTVHSYNPDIALHRRGELMTLNGGRLIYFPVDVAQRIVELNKRVENES